MQQEHIRTLKIRVDESRCFLNQNHVFWGAQTEPPKCIKVMDPERS